MKKIKPLLMMLAVFGIAMFVAVGAAHTWRFLEGPLKYVDIIIIVIGFIIFVLVTHRKIEFLNDTMEIKSLIARKKSIPYENIKSIEYIETKISGGNGIRTKVRNIMFHLKDGTSIRFAETDIKYSQCVKQLIEVYDSGKLSSKAIKPATRNRLLNSIKQNTNK